MASRGVGLQVGVFILVGLILASAPSPAWADDSDIFGANIQPNVMIFIDNSGSMADSVPSNSYNPSTTYPVLNNCTTSGSRRSTAVACTSSYVYQQGSRSLYPQYATSVSAVNNASAQTALNTAGYWQGRISGSTVNLFTGNYLNYLLGSCAAGGACLQPKMTIAKQVVNSLIDNVQGVRFGLATFYYGNWSGGTPTVSSSGGAQMSAPIGSSATALHAAVNALTPTGFTPLGEALWDLGRYFQGASWGNGTTFATPIQLACQPNYVIIVTDGMQNGVLDIKQEATRVFTTDASVSLPGLQNVIVDTVGFGTSVNTPASETAQALSDLRTAAANAGGQFYQADNATQLERALQDAIRRIMQATFTFATPVLPTTSTTGSSRAYLAAFKSDPSSPFWQGYLKAYQRDANGVVPVDSNGVPLASALVWEAGQVLTTIPAANRTIYTVVNGTAVTAGSSTTMTGSLSSFDKNNAAITATTLAVSSSTARDQLIDFVRGLDAYGANPTAERSWKLGDIFHSTPALITKPNRPLADPTYQAFKAAYANRTTILIAGANDGMLHAFRESDGAELWAFIPPDLLDNLQTLTVPGGAHDFFVDSSPIAADINIGSAWKTVVVFGLRRGGTTYYALDITNTTNPVFMWSFTDTKMGETWSEPAMGKVKVGATDKYVAFVGGGYDTGTNNSLGKAFFAIDVATGQKLWEYWNDGTADDRRYMNFSLAADPTAVDLNGDGYLDRVYIGDVGGQLWKFDVSSPSGPSAWTGKRLFAADPNQANPPAVGEYYPAQAIYGAPAVAFDAGMQFWIFFGTGDRNHPNSASSNRFYGVKDTPGMANGTTLTEADLVDVTTSGVTPTGGWFIRLAANEKVLAAANVFNSIVFFSTFTPTTVVSCGSGGGTAKLYALQMDTGLAGIDFSTGQALVSTDTSHSRSIAIGQGIPSMPVIVLSYPPPGGSGTASASASTGTTSQQLPNNPVPPPVFMKQLLYWREILR